MSVFICREVKSNHKRPLKTLVKRYVSARWIHMRSGPPPCGRIFQETEPGIVILCVRLCLLQVLSEAKPKGIDLDGATWPASLVT